MSEKREILITTQSGMGENEWGHMVDRIDSLLFNIDDLEWYSIEELDE